MDYVLLAIVAFVGFMIGVWVMSGAMADLRKEIAEKEAFYADLFHKEENKL